MCLGIWRFTAAVCWECLICRGCENNKGTTVRRDVKVFLSFTGCSQIARNQLFLHITLRKFLSSYSHTYKVAFKAYFVFSSTLNCIHSPPTNNESSKLVLHSCFHLSHRFSFYYVVVSVCNTHTHTHTHKINISRNQLCNNNKCSKMKIILYHNEEFLFPSQRGEEW